MESDLQQRYPIFNDHHQQQQQQVNSSLTRYRSAPSSYFTNIIDKEFYEDIFNRPSSPETERVISRFMNSISGGATEDSLAQNLSPVRQNSAVKEEIDQQGQVISSMNNETVVLQQQNNINNYSSAPQNFYQSSGRPPLPNQNMTSAMEGTYSFVTNRLPQMKAGGGNSNLIRHSSSPAGLFKQIDVENSLAAIRGMGAFGAGNNTNEEANFSPATGLKKQPSYSSGLMTSIAEIGDRTNRESNPENEGFAESHGNEFITGFPVGPWDDATIMSDNVTGLKRLRDDDAKIFSSLNAAETQNETGNQPAAPLAHHLSLPKTSAEMAAIEKFLQFPDSVPCKIRAKRGCATHPRSIAERVRRTKISERMRKLQDLVPNMDKQTNTADMLDLAVEYIKDLQKQVQTLSDSHSKCTCSHKQPQ
ncbi:hypothetical protein L6164_021794 [Bauhinia variegata]|uniref:Uncharacterized protein n=1 Tax=Bauhinia variegata TaxID=167791 RepID=A0ACB9MDF5_BAUVA|nr:hypothetical protein L6164_021794 [Bauhinia variegata]